MPNTREKHIDTLMHLGDHIRPHEEYELLFDTPLVEAIEYVLDMLKNGVTVQSDKDNNVPSKWISVKDRLPEQTDPATAVLGITKQGKCYVVYYYKAAINDEFTGFYDNAVKRDVTHWMPLPEPPKGE